MPYRYQSENERATAVEEALRVEVVPKEAAATIVLQPGVAEVLVRTRASSEFESVRRTIEALGRGPESPLLAEARFRDAWRSLCAVYADNSATYLEPSTSADHRAVHYAVFLYVLARVLGILMLPTAGPKLDVQVAVDWAASEAIKKLWPKLLTGVRVLVKTPALRERMETSAGIRCSTVPLMVAVSSK